MKEDLDGEINSLLLAVHDEDSDEQVSSIRHDFDKIIIVHLHNKIDKDRCLEIFSLKGDAKDVKEISRQLQVNKRMHFVKLIVVLNICALITSQSYLMYRLRFHNV